MDSKRALKRTADVVFEQLLITRGATDLAREYLDRYKDPQAAAKQLIFDNSQKAVCLAFIKEAIKYTDFPEVAGVAAGFVGVIYFQLLTISAVATIAGYDINSNEVQARAIECVAANVAARFLRSFLSTTMEKLLSYLSVDTDNAKEIAGSVAQLGIDWALTKAFGTRAYNRFILNKPSFR